MIAIARKGTNGTQTADPLFSSRMEERLCMTPEAFQRANEKLRLREQSELRGWQHNVYFDTDEQSMPLGRGARIRVYSKEKEAPPLDEKEHIVDTAVMFFSKKIKLRSNGTAKELADALDGEYPLRLTGFRPYVGVQYKRQVFRGTDLRVTVDTEIEGYEIGRDLTTRVVQLPPFAQVELKHNDHTRLLPILQALHEEGAVPGTSKHIQLYHAKVAEKRKAVLATARNDIPEMEYEAKYDAPDDAPFNRFVIAVTKGEVPGFSRWEKLPELLMLESVHDYRLVDGADYVARIMWTGTLTPEIVVKNAGTVSEGNVMKRSEMKYSPPSLDQLNYFLGGEQIGIMKRTKHYVRAKSTASGLVYVVTVDLNQKPNGDEMYQVEAEYLRTDGPAVENPKEVATGEIAKLGEFFEHQGLLKTQLRKQDWVRS